MKNNNVLDIIVEYKLTGMLEIYIDKVISKWSYLWYLAEWRHDNTWTLIKYLRKDSCITDIKINISEIQAKELIEKLNLISENNIFNSAFSWRRQIDINYINNYNQMKLKNKL